MAKLSKMGVFAKKSFPQRKVLEMWITSGGKVGKTTIYLWNLPLLTKFATNTHQVIVDNF